MSHSNFIKLLAQRLKNSEFARHVATLSTGSLLAQVIGLMAALALTRLYDPADFAILALFMAIVSTIAPAVSGRYDVAIVVAKDEGDDIRLLVLSLWVAGTISFLTLLFFTIAERPLKELLNADSLGFWWLLVPLVLFLTAVLLILNYYANKKKNYTLISRVLIVQALFSAILSISLGIINIESNGLLIAALLALILGVTLLISNSKDKLLKLNWKLNREKLSLLKKYKQFPLYEASTSFLNGLQIALPVFFLTKHYPEAVVGYYALLLKVALGPLSFISTAVSQVHLRKVAELIQQQKDTTKYLASLVSILAAIVAIPTILFMIYGAELFELFFGEKWRDAGVLLAILMPALAIRFIASTVSGAITASGNTHLGAYWKIFAFAATFSMLWTFSGKLTIENLFFAMMLTDSVIYCIYFGISWYSTKNPKDFS